MATTVDSALNMNSNKITSLANASANADALNLRFLNNFNLILPTGAIAETFPRFFSGGTSGNIANSQVNVFAIALTKGVTVSNITFVTGVNAQSGGTHGWYALLDSGGVIRAISADQTGATTWAASSAKTLAMATPYTTTYAGLYYLAVCITSTGNPNFLGRGMSLTSTFASTPVIQGTAGTQTTPPATGTTLTVASGGSVYFYAYVS